MSHRVVWGAAVALVVAAAVIVGGVHTSGPLSPEPVHAQGNLKYTGAGSCAGSNCHSNPKPRAEYPKMNENTIWLQKDAHHKAYETLTNEKLKSKVSPSKIAQNMKLGNAEKAPKCLVCHAVDVPAAQRGPKFDIAEGVQCDGCHGPAEKWLEPHAKPETWKHEDSVKAGMYDTKNFLLRAEKCVSCHLHIEADMVAAGHPDLQAFELDTFSLQMPPHWRDKGTFAPTKAWATGQVISLREAAKQLGDRAGGSATPAQINEAFGKVQGHGAMVKILMGVTAPDVQKSVEGDLATLADAVGKGDKAKITATAKNLQATMQAQAPKVAAREFDQASTKKLMGDIAGYGASTTEFRGAQQGFMGLDRLYSAYSKSPGQKVADNAKGSLDKMFDATDPDKKFDPKPFNDAAKGFGDAIK